MSFFKRILNSKLAVLNQLVHYIYLLLKQTVIYIIFALDFFGIFITYLTKFHIPKIILIILPFLAIFLAAFNIYRKGASELNLILTNIQDIKFNFVGGLGSYTKQFQSEIKGHMANFGSHSGILENYYYEVGLNKYFDEFMLSKINIKAEFSKILNSDSNYYSGRDKNLIKIPLVLNPGSIIPFKIFLDLYVDSYNQEEIEKSAYWLREINFKINYTETQKGMQREKQTYVVLPTLSLKEAIEEAKKENKNLSDLNNNNNTT